MNQYGEVASYILDNLDVCHAVFYGGGTFSGPSLHFHRRALQFAESDDLDRQLEYVYAALATWGMHRMGNGGSKMLDFVCFRDSILPLTAEVRDLRTKAISELRPADWQLLRRLFEGIRVMATGAYLVGHSKVLAHLLPNIVSPIDRNYTLKSLLCSTSLPNDLGAEWTLFEQIHKQFVLPLASSPRLLDKAETWIRRQDEFPWDTSVPKVIDNLVIGRSVKLAGVPTNR